MSLTARLGLVLGLAALLPAAHAEAVCNVTSACSAAPFIANAGCCVGSTCTIDRTVTVTPPNPQTNCDFDFGTRTVLIKEGGRLDVGSRTVTIEAGSLRIQAPGEIIGRGSATAGGGKVLITIDTEASGAPIAFGLEGASGARIDLSGGGGSPGLLSIVADGPVNFTSAGTVTANALASGTNGGTVQIDSTGGDVTIGTNFLLQSNQAAGSTAAGGTLRIRCDGPGCDVNFTGTKSVALEGDFGGAGTLDVEAGGKVTFGGGTIMRANGFNGNGGTGGEISVIAAAIDALGELQARGGGPSAPEGLGGIGGAVFLNALSGRLLVQHGTVGITADGANNGDGGEVVLVTNGFASPGAPTDGLIDVNAPLSLQGATGGGGGTFEASSGAGINVQQAIIVNGVGGGFGEVTLDAIRDITIDATIASRDPQGGGSFNIDDARDVFVNAALDMRANALAADPGGDGGEIAMFARRDVTLGAELSVNGSVVFDGGTVDITAGRHITVQQLITAVGGGGGEGIGSPGGGGQIFLSAGDLDQTGNVTVNGVLNATGPTGTVVGGGAIALQGCTIAINNTVDSRGTPASTNLIVARQGVTGTGQVLATTSNALVIRNGALAPGGSPNPAYTPEPRPVCTAPGTPPNCLMPCPTCGNGGQPEFPEQCDDANASSCDSCSDLCRTVACNDGLPCNGAESCVLDVCTNPPDVQCGVNQRCDPANGTCISIVCTNNAACNDGNVCNGAETCNVGAGQCVPGTPLVCPNDGNACTDDSCVPGFGCIAPRQIPGCEPCTVPANCTDDQNPCTTTDCVAGRCEETNIPGCCVGAADCDDANVCTTDTCEGGPPTGTCDNAPVPGACGDACEPGTCQGGTCDLDDPVVCNPDTDPCTNDFCDPVTGCASERVAGCCSTSDAECNDSDACTVDTCDTALRRCSNLPLATCVVCTTDTDCDPLGRCGQNVCGPTGACVPNTPPNCDDGDPRTQDTCTLDGGGAPVCRNQCLNQEACDDGNLCTVDVCDPVASCTSTPVQDFDTVGCRLATIRQLLDAATGEEIVDKLRQKLLKLLGQADAKLAKARTRGLTPRAKKPLNGVNKKLGAIEKATNKGFRKDQILEPLANAILDAVQGGKAAVGTLRGQLVAP